jgi:hypothetical protein
MCCCGICAMRRELVRGHMRTCGSSAVPCILIAFVSECCVCVRMYAYDDDDDDD